MNRLLVVTATIALAGANAKAAWHADSSVNLEAGTAVCRFELEVPRGQDTITGWLTNYIPEGPLRLNAGPFGPKPDQTMDDAVGKALMHLMPGALKFHFSDGVNLPLRGVQNEVAADLYIPVPMLATWVRELTTARTMTLLGEGGLRMDYDLTGAAAMVEELAKCVRDHHIVGLPEPFALSQP